MHVARNADTISVRSGESYVRLRTLSADYITGGVISFLTLEMRSELFPLDHRLVPLVSRSRLSVFVVLMTYGGSFTVHVHDVVYPYLLTLQLKLCAG